jgi:hypothetical protein
MDLFLKIQVGDKVSELEVKQVSKGSEVAVIEGLFKLLNVSSEKPTLPPVVEESPLAAVELQEAYNLVDLEVAKEERRIAKAWKVIEVKGPELQEDEPPYFDESEDKPEYWVTGIKVNHEGLKKYKCRYWCECGSQSNHFIPLGTMTVDCHECGNEIDVMPATFNFDGDGVPDRDNYGNFFVAR